MATMVMVWSCEERSSSLPAVLGLFLELLCGDSACAGVAVLQMLEVVCRQARAFAVL